MSEIIISEELNGRLKNKGLHDHRLNAMEKFNSAPKENFRQGLGIRTDLEFIDYDAAFNEGKTITSIDGKDLGVHDIIDGIESYALHEFLHSNKVDEIWKTTIKEYLSKNFHNALALKIESLHYALSNVRIIFIPDNHSSKNYMKIERIVEGNSYNHNILIIGDECKVKIYMKTSHPDEYMPRNSIITDYTTIFIGKNSDAQIIEHRDLSSRDIVYGSKIASMESSGSINWINIDKDSRLAMIDQRSSMNGIDSRCIMSNIICGKDSEYNIYNVSDHYGEQSESFMQNKSVLRNSKAIIRGLVRINKDAKASNGYQKSDALILDDKSRAISIPDLEIHNHDVKCSHGSTITRLDNEKIFYMQSRGIDRQDAQKIIIEGFYDKILALISDDDLRESIRENIIRE